MYVRHRITFSGGWDMPIDQAWKSGPKRLTQGWSLFPIVTYHTGFRFDIFARLGDRFNPGSEGPSGAGDPTNLHANITGPTNTFNPSTTQTFNGNVGNYYFNPNSFSIAQCGDANDPIATCVPGPTIFSIERPGGREPGAVYLWHVTPEFPARTWLYQYRHSFFKDHRDYRAGKAGIPHRVL
jgi:hypothetical protein